MSGADMGPEQLERVMTIRNALLAWATFFTAFSLSIASYAAGPPESEHQTPKEAWEQFRLAVKAGDEEGIWTYLSKKSQQLLVLDEEGRISNLRKLPDVSLRRFADDAGVQVTPSELRSLSTEKLARLVMLAEAGINRTKILGSTWKSVSLQGDTATITVIKPDGTEKVSVLVKEDGFWRLDGTATGKANSR